jgi:hypothetical protein
MRIVVVLPQPDGPSSEKNSPCPIDRSRCLTAGTDSPWARYVLWTPANRIAGWPFAWGVVMLYLFAGDGAQPR